MGTAPNLTISMPGQSYVEARSIDNNGNQSASTILDISVDPSAFGHLSGVVRDDGTDGRYDFANVLTGSYKLRFTDPGGVYVDEWHLDQATHASATAVAVGPQSNVVIDALLAPRPTITVHQNTVPDSPQDFAFTTGPINGPFTLDDDDDPTRSNGTVLSSLDAGTYTIVQTAVPGWTLTGLTCNTGESVDLANRTVTITLVDGENVDCTFANAQRVPDAQIASAAAGPFKGAGVASPTVTPAQTKSSGVARGGTHTFSVRAQNNGGAVDSFKVRRLKSGSAGYTVAHFRGRTDITSEVRAGTYMIADVEPGAAVTIKVKITAKTTSAAGSARNADVTIESVDTPTARDVVRARATRT